MRVDTERQANIMLAVTPDASVPDDHPIRRIKPIVDAALERLSTGSYIWRDLHRKGRYLLTSSDVSKTMGPCARMERRSSLTSCARPGSSAHATLSPRDFQEVPSRNWRVEVS